MGGAILPTSSYISNYGWAVPSSTFPWSPEFECGEGRVEVHLEGEGLRAEVREVVLELLAPTNRL